MTAIAQNFLALAARLHTLTVAVCMCLLATVFGGQLLVVMLRYLFDVGFIELQDLVTYSFGILCVLAIPTAIRTDSHVRVDVLRTNQKDGTRRAIDIVSIVFFLLPVFGTTLWFSWPLVRYSWSVLEGSRETGGLPGYFVVLTALPLSCVLVLLQATAKLVSHHER